MRYGARLAALIVAGVLALGIGGAQPAAAASSVTSGWWTSSPVAVAPDVADDQLLVQGGADASKPVAYAGISFALADGEVPEKLVLSVAPNSGTTPQATLSLCSLGAAATAAKGEPAASGPSFDCATKVDGGPSADGTSYEFAVSGLVAEGALDVAVVPTKPTDRVVLRKPAVDALQGGGGSLPSSTYTDTAGGGGFSDGSTAGGAAASDGAATLDVGALGVDDAIARASGGDASFSVPAAPAPPTMSQAGAGAGTPNSRPSVGVATRPVVDTKGSRSLAPFVFAGLAATAAALWALAGQQSKSRAAAHAGDNR